METNPIPMTEVDTARASAARVYNYYLGGVANFDVDREFAGKMVQSVPEVPVVARLNRAFLRRAVQMCVRAGVRQFLDIGSGIPGLETVYDYARVVDSACRVLYVDVEPVAVVHGREQLRGHDRSAMIWGDLRKPDLIFATPEAHRLLDLSAPLGLLMLGLLHYVSDDEDPYAIVADYRDRVAAGSHLVLSHGTDDGRPDAVRRMVDLAATSQNPAYMRSRDQIARFLTGFKPLWPGVVFLPDWRPESPDDAGTPAARLMAYGAVGRKP